MNLEGTMVVLTTMAPRERHYLKGLGGLALLEQVSLGVGFEVSESPLQAQSLSLFLLPFDPDVKHSQPLQPVGHQASHHDDKGLNLNCKQSSIKCFLHKSYCGHGVSFQQ